MKKAVFLLTFMMFFFISLTSCGNNDTGNGEITPTEIPVTYTVSFAPYGEGHVEGETVQTVQEGASCASVKAVAALGYRFAGWSNGCTDAQITYTPTKDETLFAVFETDSSTLPVLFIETEDGKAIDTKEDYVSCKVTLSGADEGDAVDGAEAKIKLRGNTTAYLSKHPYKLKFEEKTDLFGNGKAKTWTLIANYLDYSLVRNYLAFTIGAELDDLNYITSVRFVDVYVNGSYDGVYTVCEQVEVGKNRVEIDESYDTTDTGYLIEMDMRAPSEGKENLDYFTLNHPEKAIHYAVKSPDTEDEEYTEEHTAFIKSYLEECLAALESGDFERVKEYVDVKSFADSYIINELFHCVDVGYSSFYMYKEKGGKLTSGPLWDYDLSLGNCAYNSDAINAQFLWAKNDNYWYSALLEYGEFYTLVAEKLADYAAVIRETLKSCIAYIQTHSDAFERNFERWNVLGVKTPETEEYIPTEIYEIDTWQGQLKYVEDWIYASLENLQKCYYVN